MRIGFIGAGAMGLPMIKHLIAAGHEVAGFARSRATEQALLEAGARVAHTYAQCVRDAQVLFTNVTLTTDVEQVLVGADGVLQHASAGLICIDMSTISPSTTRHLSEQLLEKGITLLDAPVSGGEVGAQQATLSIMVGGPPRAFETVQPLLAKLGSRITYIGPSGAGQVAKCCNQIAQVINIQGIAEALAFAQAQGVSLDAVLQAISAGMAGSRMLDLMGPKMASADFNAGIQSRLHAKDMQMIEQEVQAIGLTAPAIRLASHQLERLQAQGKDKWDTSALITLLTVNRG